RGSDGGGRRGLALGPEGVAARGEELIDDRLAGSGSVGDGAVPVLPHAPDPAAGLGGDEGDGGGAGGGGGRGDGAVGGGVGAGEGGDGERALVAGFAAGGGDRDVGQGDRGDGLPDLGGAGLAVGAAAQGPGEAAAGDAADRLAAAAGTVGGDEGEQEVPRPGRAQRRRGDRVARGALPRRHQAVEGEGRVGHGGDRRARFVRRRADVARGVFRGHLVVPGAGGD